MGGGAPLAIGAGVLSDLWRPNERGRAAALYSLGPLLGPAIGPVFGAWVAEKLPTDGYKWIFYSTTIFSALVQGLGLILLRETYHPILLDQQATKLKKSMNLPKGSDKVQTIFEVKSGGKKSPREVFVRGMTRPFVMFFHEPIIQVQALFMALLYGVSVFPMSFSPELATELFALQIIYMMLVSTTGIFQNIFNQSVGIAGTNFVSLLSLRLETSVADSVSSIDRYGCRFLRRFARRGSTSRCHVSQTQGTLWYRWQTRVSTSLPIPSCRFDASRTIDVRLGSGKESTLASSRLWNGNSRVFDDCEPISLTFFNPLIITDFNPESQLIFQSTQLYLIDAFTLHAASAISATVCARSLFGFALPLAAPYMWQSLGYGWGCTLLAGASILISWPMVCSTSISSANLQLAYDYRTL